MEIDNIIQKLATAIHRIIAKLCRCCMQCLVASISKFELEESKNRTAVNAVNKILSGGNVSA